MEINHFPESYFLDISTVCMIRTEHITEAVLQQVMHLLSIGTHVRPGAAVFLVYVQKGILVVEWKVVCSERNSSV